MSPLYPRRGRRQRTARPISSTETLQRHRGLFTTATDQLWYRHWRDPYLLLRLVSWPLFFGLILLGFLLINLIFVGLYRLDPSGLRGYGNTDPSILYLFSAQTLGSAGVPSLQPVSLLGHGLVIAEHLVGLGYFALTTALIFARFSRSTARIRFSQVAVIHPWNGVDTLFFRVVNERRNTILDARLKAVLAVDEVSQEGHRLRRLYPLPLIREDSIAFLLTWTGMHVIDAASPLARLSPAALAQGNGEIIVAFSGVDEDLERSIHARDSYPVEQIARGYCFEDMVETRGDTRLIDLSRFNRIRPCPSSRL